MPIFHWLMDSCTFQFTALNNNKVTAAHTAAPQSRDTVNGFPAFLMSKNFLAANDVQIRMEKEK